VANLRFNDRGRYVFGKIPYEKKDVRFWEGDIEEKDFWRLPVTSYAIGGIENGRDEAAKKTDFKAIVDTGASSLHLPSDIVQNYYAKVPGHIQQSGQHLVPSGQVLPDLVLYIGGESYPVRIPGKFLQPQGPVNELCELTVSKALNETNTNIPFHKSVWVGSRRVQILTAIS
jgi:hypothetical protein